MVHILSSLSILNTEIEYKEFDSCLQNFQQSYKYSSMGLSQKTYSSRKLTDDDRGSKEFKNCILNRTQLDESIWDSTESN